MELSLSRYFNYFTNIVVPNVSWGMDLHECDLFILSKAGFATEVEIKVSAQDLKADIKKAHSHENHKIKYLYFAIPHYLEKHSGYIPKRAGILSLKKRLEDGYIEVNKIREPVKNGNYRYSMEEKLKLQRLGVIRIWSLKHSLEQSKQWRKTKEVCQEGENK